MSETEYSTREVAYKKHAICSLNVKLCSDNTLEYNLGNRKNKNDK